MPWFANDDDKYASLNADYWWEIAEIEVDDIGGWRDHHTEKRFPRSSSGNGEPEWFRHYTCETVSWIARKLPSLNPSPIQTIYAAVNAWHTDWNADRIPPQNELEGILRQAQIILSALRDDVRSRVTDKRPGEITETPKLERRPRGRPNKADRDDDWLTEWERDKDYYAGVQTAFAEAKGVEPDTMSKALERARERKKLRPD
jgi:hypothetical protein